MCGFLKDYSCRGGSITIFERVRNCHFIFRLLTNFKASKRLVNRISKCAVISERLNIVKRRSNTNILQQLKNSPYLPDPGISKLSLADEEDLASALVHFQLPGDKNESFFSHSIKKKTNCK